MHLVSRTTAASEVVHLERGKEVSTVAYKKPEITVLGDAARVIQTINKPGGVAEVQGQTPAYDLDEE